MVSFSDTSPLETYYIGREDNRPPVHLLSRARGLPRNFVATNGAFGVFEGGSRRERRDSALPIKTRLSRITRYITNDRD